ncbi:MAG: hypothetical protein P4L53_13580 [Candidatus Obscuribacterales bacterium]|nr:hypothetical protein [Candidatus Obscuribacterales bacterium]
MADIDNPFESTKSAHSEPVEPSLIHSIMDSRQTWQHVTSGKSTTTEKIVAGVESVAAVAAVAVASKVGMGSTVAKVEKETVGIAAIPDVAASSPLKQGLNRVFVESDGERRPFDVFVPERLNPEKPTPLVLALHGVTGGGAARGLMEAETGLNSLAQEMANKDGVGAIIAYPVAREKVLPFTFGKATLHDWNSPGAGLTATRPGYDDVNYLRSIVDTLKANPSINVDSQAQHLVGFSSGAEFAIHTHNSLPGYFAGIGSIHGTVLGTEAAAVEGNRAAFVAVLGENDHMLPMKGGRGFMTAIGYPKIADSQPLKQAIDMAKANGHEEEPLVMDSKIFKLTQYAGNAESPAVHEFVVKNGQHAIDGVRGTGGWPIIGAKNPNFEAIDVVLSKLLRHRLPSGALDVSRTLEKVS